MDPFTKRLHRGLLADFATDLDGASRWSPHASLATKYFTDLPAQDESAFRQWVADNNVPFDPDDRHPDYDMWGFYKAMKAGDPKARSAIDQYDKKLHFTDYFKTPTHETYSNESQGALPTAPRWIDGRYLVSESGNVLFDAASKR